VLEFCILREIESGSFVAAIPLSQILSDTVADLLQSRQEITLLQQ
jgi:hypothetical protein